MKRSLIPLLLGLALAMSACQPRLALVPTNTPDFVALETSVAAKLAATLTAKAPPTSTRTPNPTVPPTAKPSPKATFAPTATPQPTFAHPERLLAYAWAGEGQEANILLYDTVQGETQVLTHFAEPLNINDLSWSKDGQWIVFVSSHDYMHSRSNEHNIFMMRPDGTDLAMITGDYMSPNDAPGPYVKLSGQVSGSEGYCFVCAQGVPGVTKTDDQGRFDLAGVPISARWARAVCQQNGTRLQGDIDLQSTSKDGDEQFDAIEIAVTASGQGWEQASLSADGQRLAGIKYAWSLNEENALQTASEAKVINLADRSTRTLQVDENMRFDSLDWSPNESRIVGALVGQDGVQLGYWDANGAPLSILLDLHNPEDDILGIANPVWSPDGKSIAFELQHRYWWEGDRYRTDIQLITLEGDELSTLIENDWGIDARNPSWLADGQRLTYQVTPAKESEDSPREKLGEIRSAWIARPTPTIWIPGNQSYLPAARPAPHIEN